MKGAYIAGFIGTLVATWGAHQVVYTQIPQQRLSGLIILIYGLLTVLIGVAIVTSESWES